MKLVMVEWLDSQSFTRLVDYDTLDNDSEMRCMSVGWLVEERDDRVVIVSHLSNASEGDMDHPHQVAGHMMIPCAAITQMWELV